MIECKVTYWLAVKLLGTLRCHYNMPGSSLCRGWMKLVSIASKQTGL